MGKGEQHYIWPSQCKYANMPFSNVYLRGSAADKMFSIPNISEFGPMGGRGVGILKKGGTYSCNQGSHQKKNYETVDIVQKRGGGQNGLVWLQLISVENYLILLSNFRKWNVYEHVK